MHKIQTIVNYIMVDSAQHILQFLWCDLVWNYINKQKREYENDNRPRNILN